MRYYETYLRRVNRYGYDFKHRIQGEREEEFEYLLLKSVYRIDFEYKGQIIPGVFEPFSQNETKTLHYLLTRNCDELESGTILMLPKEMDGPLEPWLVYWPERIEASGYRRYVMLRMTHFITWKDRDGVQQSTWGYFYGQEDNMLKDELKSRSRMMTLYTENLKLSFFITPKNSKINKDDYFTLGNGEYKKGYRVTGYDFDSTENVEYVSVDPIYLFDESAPPQRQETDSDEDFFWLDGGVQNGST